MRSLLLGVLLCVSPSLALAAPFDLGELRDRHPGVDRVHLESRLTVSMPSPDILRTVQEKRTAILEESARDDFSMFGEEHRPGCREVREVRVRVTTRDDEEHRLA
jgi:hypothetical protein